MSRFAVVLPAAEIPSITTLVSRLKLSIRFFPLA